MSDRHGCATREQAELVPWLTGLIVAAGTVLILTLLFGG